MIDELREIIARALRTGFAEECAEPLGHQLSDDLAAGVLVELDAAGYAVVRKGSIEHYLENLKFRQTGDDPKLNAYHYAEIPDWQLKQWLTAAKGEGHSEDGDQDAT